MSFVSDTTIDLRSTDSDVTLILGDLETRLPARFDEGYAVIKLSKFQQMWMQPTLRESKTFFWAQQPDGQPKQQMSVVLPAGIYNGETMCSALQQLMNSTNNSFGEYKVTYDNVQSKVTIDAGITHADRIHAGYSANGVNPADSLNVFLGIVTTSTVLKRYLTSEGPVRFSPYEYIYVCCNWIDHTYVQTRRAPVLAKVPINVSNGFELIYYSSLDDWKKSHYISNELNIRLLDENLEPLNKTGFPWSATISVNWDSK